MSLSREEIVVQLKEIVGSERVITDEKVLQKNSVDRFRKYADIHGVFTQPLPAAVVKLANTQQVADVLAFMNKHGINGVPRTGASATEGGLETVVKNSVVLDGSAMNKVISIDIRNMQATAQCGVPLEVLENQLRAQGYTTGHSPQSKPLAQMGGLVATRSIGQFSTLYGAIEDMVVGLEAVFPNGTITRIKNVPRRAAGPDIRHVIIGNEGALCFITEVTVKIFKYMPENNLFYGYILDNMQTGFNILREVMVEGYRPSIARLYDAEDGTQHFTHFAEGKCVLIFMAEGAKGIAQATGAGIEEIVKRYPECKRVDSKLIETWFNNLNWGPDKVAAERVQIMKTNNMGFTTEVSGDWASINTIYENVIRRIREEFPHAGDITMLGGHSSHSYINGTNMYFVYDYNVVDCKPEEEIDKYHNPLNKIIVEETIKQGGSMVHHHGIGKHRVHWTKDEHGSAYYILKALKEVYDPNGIMNTGTIYPIEK
ncbi:alkyldihydroxyacetonephosphate synthase [Serratia fonticola]|uniref:Alkyldihydroxyacetonephosphate synthase n=1 Tax=Serratia fonticola TaxID=47917 RepID=A0A542BVJ1_SERFO|nr:FAD-binding oxidoreductase [Serratia fonticola]TQI82567.1 alkyldihydroxyacetonephosphate synthase [Serratia fonticola]TQI95416.1 alkyldihydroxyacetonephosphate synthase [Serratia fonticola]TVZ69911.1 alkyldihydroxyacetonephosphate synthase [Serratia fonticola]